MKKRFKKPSLLPCLIGLGALAILCWLGTWQATKFIDKTAGRSDICTQNSSFVQEVNFSDFSDNQHAFCPEKLSLRGYLDTNIIIPIGPRVYKDSVGFHLYAPLRAVDDGSVILVNLGWAGDKNLPWHNHTQIHQTSAETQHKTPITITGSLIKPKDKNIFTLQNNPSEREWYAINTSEIATYFDIENLSIYTLFAKNSDPALPEVLPPATLSKLYLTPQTHLQYAAFWYAMALALLIIFVLRFAIEDSK